MVSKIVNFLSSKNKTISQHNIPLSYLTRFLSTFILIMPVRILWMQQTLSNSQISILTGWLFISIVIFELPTGAFADLVGKKITLLISYLVYALSMILYLWATDFLQFGIAITLQSLAEALQSGAEDALIYDSLAEDGLENNFKVINAKVMTVNQFGLIGATFAGGLLGSFNLKFPFIGFTIILIISAIISSFMKEPSIDTEKFTLKNYYRQIVDGTKQIFKHSRLIKLTLLYTLVGGISWTFQRLLRDMILISVGYQQLSLGLITGTFRLINIIFLAKLAKSVKANNGKWDILFLPIIMIMSYIPGFWLNHWNSLPLVAGIMMIGTGRFLILNPYLHQEIESKYRATAMSAANLFVSLFLGINMIGLGFILDKVGIPKVMLTYGLVSIFVVLPLAWEVRKEILLARNYQ
ncbi:MAG: hypothetical protein COZ34_04155 [Candidatus Pacebacteria bacterium CG_4_10_14_3_um_filter_34_15]|nr:MAG: hypothetical protein COZ34_04155 [Candidatus Pacebacteria bacterium CG_4_10_14_3_um_filter_34_15]